MSCCWLSAVRSCRCFGNIQRHQTDAPLAINSAHNPERLMGYVSGAVGLETAVNQSEVNLTLSELHQRLLASDETRPYRHPYPALMFERTTALFTGHNNIPVPQLVDFRFTKSQQFTQDILVVFSEQWSADRRYFHAIDLEWRAG